MYLLVFIFKCIAEESIMVDDDGDGLVGDSYDREGVTEIERFN